MGTAYTTDAKELVDNTYKLCVVGCGGIGTFLLAMLSRLVLMPNSGWELRTDSLFNQLTLVDGDIYEKKNLARQFFPDDAIGMNKAEVQKRKLQRMVPWNDIVVVDDYLTEENIEKAIPPSENLIIMSCVDNHAARLLLSRYVEKIKWNNVVLITGGNNETDGSVHIQGRWGGVDISSPIEQRHPEIITDKTDDRSTMSCQELQNLESGQQLLGANAGAAVFMYWAMWCLLNNPKTLYNVEDVYFDMNTMAVKTVRKQIEPTVVVSTVPEAAAPAGKEAVSK